MTQKSLQLTVEALGNQLEDIKVELEQEKEKCLLLMDYPSLNAYISAVCRNNSPRIVGHIPQRICISHVV